MHLTELSICRVRSGAGGSASGQNISVFQALIVGRLLSALSFLSFLFIFIDIIEPIESTEDPEDKKVTMHVQLFLVLLGAYGLANCGVEALECYECNSHNDSQCAEEKVPPTLKKDCSEHVEGSKYTMCRKITQVIEFSVNGLPADTRVIRGCGWDESTYKGKCYQRSGFGGRQEVCSCTTDLCNAATTNTITSHTHQILIPCFLVSTALSFLRN